MNDILKKPLTELGFGDEFVERAGRMHLRTIGEIVRMPPAELLGNKHFSYRWLEELTAWLAAHQLTALLQPLPGNSAP
jgi:hypothetical protein